MASQTIPVSVVIPASDCGGMIGAALTSVGAQAPAPAEVIVVDDGSSDATAALAESKGARVVRHAQPQGVAAARNSGLEAASNEWVALLDCDDEWLPGHLATLWRARADHVIVGSAALGWGDAAADHRFLGYAAAGPLVVTSPAQLFPENKLRTSGVLLRRDLALSVGGFDRRLARAEELDLWVRMLEHGTALVIPQVTTLYRQHAAQTSHDRELMWDAQAELLDRYRAHSWCTTSLIRHREGVVAWDRRRVRLAAGEATALVYARLAGELLRDPRRIAGLAEALRGRAAGRRVGERMQPRAGLPRGDGA